MEIKTLGSLMSYSAEKPEPKDMVRNKPYTVLRGNGIFRYVNTGVILLTEKIRDIEPALPFLPSEEESVVYALEQKVPFSYLHRIMDFFKYVYEKNHTEACAIVYRITPEILEQMPQDLRNDYDEVVYQEEGSEFIIYCPYQQNSSTITVFKDDLVYDWLNKNAYSVAEWHSHHTMDAFWSGTDIANQKDLIYYGVLGKINTEDKILFKYVVDNQLTNIPVSEVFDFPQVKVTRSVVETVKTELLTHNDLLASDEVTDSDVSEEVHDYVGVIPRKDEFPNTWFARCTQNKYITESNFKSFKGSEQRSIGFKPYTFGGSNPSPHIKPTTKTVAPYTLGAVADEDDDIEPENTTSNLDQYLEFEKDSDVVGKNLEGLPTTETEKAVSPLNETKTENETKTDVDDKNTEEQGKEPVEPKNNNSKAVEETVAENPITEQVVVEQAPTTSVTPKDADKQGSFFGWVKRNLLN